MNGMNRLGKILANGDFSLFISNFPTIKFYFEITSTDGKIDSNANPV